uniref:F-box protein At3g26010-like beta-propeller domain-containing protein n=1 Tax=Brassica oleracea var. oleracea TaxID=109376 RepID=A0A0D3D2J3_BRAOL
MIPCVRAERAGVSGPLAVGGRGVTSGIRDCTDETAKNRGWPISCGWLERYMFLKGVSSGVVEGWVTYREVIRDSMRVRPKHGKRSGGDCRLWVVGALHVSRGSLMYMNIAAQGDEHDKLSVWRLKSSWEWQIVSEVSYIGYKHPYIPLAINPFDAETVYFWSNDLDNQCLVSMNLRIGEFVFHGKLERSSSDGCIVKSPEGHTFIQLAQEFS